MIALHSWFDVRILAFYIKDSCLQTFLVRIAICCLLCLFNACSTYKIRALPSDSLEQSFVDGIEVFVSQKPNSYVRFEIAQNSIGGFDDVPFVVYVVASILSKSGDGESVVFDIANVSAVQDNKTVPILTPEQIKNSHLDFGKAIESFGIATSPNPYIAPSTTISPMYPILLYRGYPGFFAYDPWVFGARDRIEQNMRLEENRRLKSIILSSYLRKNTLKHSHAPRGGFIAFDKGKLKVGVLEIRVKILDEIHSMRIQLDKK